MIPKKCDATINSLKKLDNYIIILILYNSA